MGLHIEIGLPGLFNDPAPLAASLSSVAWPISIASRYESTIAFCSGPCDAEPARTNDTVLELASEFSCCPSGGGNGSAAEALAACKKRCRGLTKWLCDGINVVPLEAPELLITNTSVNDRGIPWGKGGASFHSHQQLGWLLSCPSFPPHAHTKLTLAPHTHIRAVTSPHIIPVGCLPRATRKTAMRTASSTSSRRSELIHLSATRSKRQAFASLRRTGRWLRRTCTTKCGTRRATYSSRCASSLASPQRCALHPRPPCPRTRCATT